MKRNIFRILALGLLVLATGSLRLLADGGLPPPIDPPSTTRPGSMPTVPHAR